MVGDASMLSDIEKIPSMSIDLPHGAHVLAGETGLASLGGNLMLKNIL